MVLHANDSAAWRSGGRVQRAHEAYWAWLAGWMVSWSGGCLIFLGPVGGAMGQTSAARFLDGDCVVGHRLLIVWDDSHPHQTTCMCYREISRLWRA